ncbi:MAG: hypothetical protein WCJ87_12245 [Burkholderiales bacterium]
MTSKPLDSPAKPKPVADWERIEVDYRAGAKSVREIAAEFGVSHTAIQKRAAKHEWTRDLKAKIKAEADAKVAKALVASEVAVETKVTETITIEVEARVQARIRLAHRADIATARRLAMALLAELEHQTLNADEFRQLGELMITMASDDGANPQRIQKLSEAFERAMSLAGRVKTMKDLADTLRILVDKEREAFGIGDDAAKPASDFATELAAFIGRIHEEDSGKLQFTPPRLTH